MYYQPHPCTTHAEREWAGGTFLRQQKKVPPAQAQRVWPGGTDRVPSPHRIIFSVCPSACLSGIPKHVDFSCRNYNQGVHVEFSVHRPSPPNNYSYVREENLGSTQKFVEIYLLITCIKYYQPHLLCVGWRNCCFAVLERFPQPTHSKCIFYVIWCYSCH